MTDVMPPVVTPQGDLLTSPGGNTMPGPVEEHPACPLGTTKATPKKGEGAPTLAEKKRKWVDPEE